MSVLTGSILNRILYCTTYANNVLFWNCSIIVETLSLPISESTLRSKRVFSSSGEKCNLKHRYLYKLNDLKWYKTDLTAFGGNQIVLCFRSLNTNEWLINAAQLNNPSKYKTFRSIFRSKMLLTCTIFNNLQCEGCFFSLYDIIYKYIIMYGAPF